MMRVPDVLDRLRKHEPTTTPFDPLVRRSAVALVLAGEGESLWACFIRRADRIGDHWSGHMALPGGRSSPMDSSARAVAEREAHEEVGLKLGDPEYVSPLSELRVRHEGIETDERLSPFVYYVGSERPALRPNEEVAQALWVLLADLASPGRKAELRIRRQSVNHIYPAIRLGENLIWGLTYRILQNYAGVVGLKI